MDIPSETLLEVQKWMQLSLIDPNIETIAAVDHYVLPSKTLTSAQRLAIYQRSYYSRLIECMRSQFKALHYTLGNELFDDFSRLYLKEKPSSSPSLGHLGEGFPDFLNRTRPDKAHPELWIDFMIAMAQFECDLYRIFDQKGSEGKLFANEKTLNDSLVLQDCFEIYNYPFDVNQYYQEVAQENKPEITKTNAIYVAFVRTNYQVRIISLTALQYEFLCLLIKGETVSEVLSRFSSKLELTLEEIYVKWDLWKKQWIGQGFFLEK